MSIIRMAARLTEAGVTTVARAVGVLEQLPGSPHWWAGRAIDRHFEERRRRASDHPLWTDIEARRRQPDSTTFVMFSDHLDGNDWDTQRKIEDELTPDPWWLGAARRVHQFSLRSTLRSAVFASQRARRGWDEPSTWDIGSDLTRRLAAQLDFLAEHAHGWPDTDEFPTFEDWTSALKFHASQLRRFDGGAAATEALEVWSTLSRDRAADRADVESAWEHLVTVEAADRHAARRSMFWVAEHLDILWD